MSEPVLALPNGDLVQGGVVPNTFDGSLVPPTGEQSLFVDGEAIPAVDAPVLE